MYRFFKGIVHKKIDILKQYEFFFCWVHKKIFWRMLRIPIDFHSISPVTGYCQYLILCSTEKKCIHVWNNLRVNKWQQIFHFWVNCSFKYTLPFKFLNNNMFYYLFVYLSLLLTKPAFIWSKIQTVFYLNIFKKCPLFLWFHSWFVLASELQSHDSSEIILIF